MEASAQADLCQRFLSALWPDTGEGSRILLWTLPGKASTWYESPEAAAEAAISMAQSLDVYTGVGTRYVGLAPGERGGYDSISALCGVFVDIDFGVDGHRTKNLPPTADEALKLVDFEPRPTWTIHSGGGLHAWWLFREPWIFEKTDDHERSQAQLLARRWQRLIQLRAAAAGYDMDNTADLARVLRIPGTFNRKIPGHPRLVTVVEESGERFNPSELIELLDEGNIHLPAKAFNAPEANPEWAQIKIDANAAVSPLDIEGLRMTAPQFEATWTHQRPDFQKQSISEYDFSLANMAAAAGWPRQRIVNLLLMHRKKYGAKAVSLSYFQRTVGAAMKSREAKQAQAKAKVVEIPKQPDLAKGHAITELSALCKTKIKRFVKVGEEDPMYRLESEVGAAIFSCAQDWLDYGSFRRIVAARFDKITPVLKPFEWKNFCELLMIILEKEAADEETEITGRMLMWLNAYIEHKQVFECWQMVEGRKDRTEPHLGDPEGQRGVFVNSTNLAAWLETKYGERLEVKDLAARFKMIKAELVCFRGGNRKSHRSRHNFWRLPDEHFSLDRFEVEPADGREEIDRKEESDATRPEDIV